MCFSRSISQVSLFFSKLLSSAVKTTFLGHPRGSQAVPKSRAKQFCQVVENMVPLFSTFSNASVLLLPTFNEITKQPNFVHNHVQKTSQHSWVEMSSWQLVTKINPTVRCEATKSQKHLAIFSPDDGEGNCCKAQHTSRFKSTYVF